MQKFAYISEAIEQQGHSQAFENYYKDKGFSLETSSLPELIDMISQFQETLVSEKQT
jgi:hypothetical protein